MKWFNAGAASAIIVMSVLACTPVDKFADLKASTVYVYEEQSAGNRIEVVRRPLYELIFLSPRGDDYQVYPITNCGTSTFVCVAAGPMVFAVPKRPLHDGLAYDVRQTRFAIEQCVVSEKKVCITALVRAELLWVPEDFPHDDVNDADKVAPYMRTMYYIYNVHDGIRSMGFVDDASLLDPPVTDSFAVGQIYGLQQSPGLLSKEWNETAWRLVLTLTPPGVLR